MKLRFKLVELLIGLALVLFVGMIAYDCYNPCVRYDPHEKTYWQTTSCGDNCWYTYPVTYHECLERQR